MSLGDELKEEVAGIFRQQWTERVGNKVPESEDLQLTNDGVHLDATVLYADMTDSTALVDSHTPLFAAEVYKAFLHCAAKIVRSEGGEITAYDGDRLMGVFIGAAKNTSAGRAALKIHHARRNIINPAIKAQYPQLTYSLQHVVGIDTSKIFVARTGIRGANDLVWVGRAANHAAKLCTLPADYPTWVTGDVYDQFDGSVKVTNGKSMWEARSWTAMGNRRIYRSNWHWPT